MTKIITQFEGSLANTFRKFHQNIMSSFFARNVFASLYFTDHVCIFWRKNIIKTKNNLLALLIRDTLCRNLALNSLMVRPPSHLNSTSIKKRI